jgi:hypothetical protein
MDMLIHTTSKQNTYCRPKVMSITNPTLMYNGVFKPDFLLLHTK